MKKKTVILLAAALILLLAAAAFLYPRLIQRYTPDSSPADSSPADSASSETVSLPEESSPKKIPAPDFTVLDAEGNSVSLSDFFGKPIVINFWATWCGPCKSELPAFQSLSESYGQDVTFLMVNMTDGSRDTVDGVKEFLADNGYTFPVYFDTEQNAATAYGAYSIPATAFIDTEGMVVNAYLGAMSEQTLTNCIESLLEGTK